jgi:hypothetical protein
MLSSREEQAKRALMRGNMWESSERDKLHMHLMRDILAFIYSPIRAPKPGQPAIHAILRLTGLSVVPTIDYSIKSWGRHQRDTSRSSEVSWQFPWFFYIIVVNAMLYSSLLSFFGLPFTMMGVKEDSQPAGNVLNANLRVYRSENG